MNSNQDINNIVENMLTVAKAENIKKYKEWSHKIPSLKFPSDWKITIIPPFGGAMVRFMVTRDEYPDQSVSVYLDCDDSLGCVGQPYWEIYPFKEDTYRFLMNETDDLMDGIDLAFGNRRKVLTKS